jgi:hypothetical protein
MNKETLRMQMLAGIITEGEYKVKLNEETTPEQAVSKAIEMAPKLEKSSELDQLAQKVANDPNLLAQMEKALEKGGITLNEGKNDLDVQDMKTLALTFAKKENQMNEDLDAMFGKEDKEGIQGGLSMAAFVGGSGLGAALGKVVLAVLPSLSSIFAGPGIAGGIAGVALYWLAKKVYQKMASKQS